MKKYFLLLILAALLPMVANADESGQCGENVTWTYIESNHKLIISGNGPMMDYGKLKTYDLDNSWSWNISPRPWEAYNNDILIVEIDEGVTTIGNFAFYSSEALTTVRIPNTLITIGECAFYNCTNLLKVSIPNSMTLINKGAFQYCRNLTTISLGNSLTSIEDGTFYGCDQLIEVIIPDNIKTIGNNAFQYCGFLAKLTIGNGVTFIGRSAFKGCRALKSINISDLNAWCNIEFKNQGNPLSQGHKLILNGVEIKDLIIPDGVTEIKDYAFNGGDFNSVIIPKGVTSIGISAFDGCNKMTSILIPDGVTSIGSYAFSECEEMSSILLPNSIESLGYGIFSGCISLLSVTIPNGVSKIDKESFSGCAKLNSISIPNSVLSIEQYAFFNCRSLRSIILPEGLISIGPEAFLCCENINSISIPDNVTIINEGTFNGCTRLVTVELPEKLEIIRNGAFNNCTSLKSILIPASVEYMYQDVFLGCNYLESIKVKAVTPPFAYDNTFSNFDMPLYVPETSVSVYKNTSPWSNFTSFKTLNGGDVVIECCEMPTISYQNGKLMFNSATEGATCHYSISDIDIRSGAGNEVQLTATYNISVYASKSGYKDSDVANATLCWIDKEPVIDVTNVSQVPAKAVLIQSEGGVLTVQGLDDGQQVRVYGIDGTQAGAAVSSNGQAVVGTNLKAGSVAIIKIGDRSVKVAVK